MGVEHIKSTTITSLDSIPVELAKRHFQGGTVRCVTETVTATNGDAADSTYRMNRVHSSWLFVAMAINHGDTGGSSKIDIGFYETTRNGGAVVVKDCLSDNYNSSSASETGWSQETADGTTGTPQYLWEIAGLSSDPNKYWDLTITVATAIADTVPIQINPYYTDGS